MLGLHFRPLGTRHLRGARSNVSFCLCLWNTSQLVQVLITSNGQCSLHDSKQINYINLNLKLTWPFLTFTFAIQFILQWTHLLVLIHPKSVFYSVLESEKVEDRLHAMETIKRSQVDEESSSSVDQNGDRKLAVLFTSFLGECTVTSWCLPYPLPAHNLSRLDLTIRNIRKEAECRLRARRRTGRKVCRHSERNVHSVHRQTVESTVAQLHLHEDTHSLTLQYFFVEATSSHLPVA